jgi:hypothetical protein
MFHRVIGRRVVALLLALVGAQAALAADVADTEVRVLIDASGSMKSNDPANLRAPSLRLLARLLPDGMQAGVWQFGDDISELVPTGTVDDAWRRKAVERASKVGSRDLFTDVEAAVLTATADWARPRKGVRREIIILTDGIIDVADGKAESAASRKRLLGSQLAQLRRAGVTVNTIALSKKADAELMQTLSARTGGYHETISSASELERAFLRMVESSTSPDSLPIRDDGFLVDDGVREVTLVVFRRPGDPPTRVIPPGGAPITAQDAPENVSWESDDGYDLVTIDAPNAGRWRLEARSDPDNRALVLTDLTLRATELSGTIASPKARKVRAALMNGAERIDAPEILDATVFSLRIVGPDSRSRDLPLKPSERSGAYTAQLPALQTPGRHEVIITAESPTFVRERRQSLQVPATAIPVEAPPAEEIVADDAEVVTEHGEMEADPAPGGHGEINYSTRPAGEAGQGHAEESSTDADEGADGHEASTDEPTADGAEGRGDDGESVANEEIHNESAPDGTEGDTESGSSMFNASLLTNIALVLGFNALLGGASYFGYRRWKRHRATVGAAVEAI